MPVRGVRDPKELAGLALARRAVVRLGALAKRNIDVTAAVLELALPAGPFESALLDPELLKHAKDLDAAQLDALVAKHDPEGTLPPLALAEAEGWRTIALAEEIDVADGWAEAAGAAASHLPATTAADPPAAPVDASTRNDTTASRRWATCLSAMLSILAPPPLNRVDHISSRVGGRGCPSGRGARRARGRDGSPGSS